MQRLFSTFPNSWPGAGLLVLRLASGLPLLIQRVPISAPLPAPYIFAIQAGAYACGCLLLSGFGTPYAASLLMLLETWVVYTSKSFDPGHIATGCMALSLIMIGPGAWSIDARLFGRKRIDFNR